MIKFLLGRQTDRLQEKILDHAVAAYSRHPENETFIIVPNHIKFTTEVNAISKLAQKSKKTEAAVKNLQVLSFSRLAWYYQKKQAQTLPAQLDDAAAAMLLQQVIAAHQSELLLFQNAKINPGLVHELYESILQVHEGNLSLSDIDQTQLNAETQNKVHDLQIIYDDFMKRIEGKFTTKNDLGIILNNLLRANKKLGKASFYFTDFSHFSLQEMITIKLLMKKAQQVELAFKTKTGAINDQPQEGDYDYVIQQTIANLLHFVDRQQLPCQIEQAKLPAKLSPREVLNAVWTGISNPPQELNQVQLVKADSRYSEAYFVAHTIYQQVALSNYRYQDFLILAPNLHEYETYLIPILRANHIPFFNDLQQEMKYHPLVVLIENLFKLLKKPYQSQYLIAILKTQLLIPASYHETAAYLNDVDELENFVLAHGINHELWQRPFTSFVDAQVIPADQYPDEIGKLDHLRQYIIKIITEFFAHMKEETDSKKAITYFLSDFLTKNGVAKRLDEWRRQADQKGDLQQAQQPEQLWDLLLRLLHDYLLISPDHFDLTSFFEMLVTAFKTANFAQIPSTLDAVNISEMGMVQNSSYKQVFLLGATSNNLPQIEKTPAFINSENLQAMRGSFAENAYLEDEQQLHNLDQDYQFGLALSLASDRVYVSYPVLNADNEKLSPSLYYERLKRAHAPEMCQHDLPAKSQELLSFLTNDEASLGYIVYLYSLAPNKTLRELINLAGSSKAKQVLAGIKFSNQPVDIGSDLAEQLYGRNLNASVSQLETYYENSYEYFLTYGLKLHKRFENQFDVIQAGNYFHETFDRLVKELNQKKLDLANISDQQLQTLLNTARAQMKDEGIYRQLRHDPFNAYLFRCLDRTTSKVAFNWRRSLKATPLRAKYSELNFGLGEKVKGLSLPVSGLTGKHQVNLRGKIDRVDLAALKPQDQVLGQIIDYKSSAKKFDPALFYNGITLQMVSYLDILVKNSAFFTHGKHLSLLGAFYQTITRKLDRLNSKALISPQMQLKKEALDSKPHLLYKGLISNDPVLLKEAEPLLLKEKSSSLYSGLRSKAKGGVVLPRNTNFSPEEMTTLLQYDEYLIKNAAYQILSGQLKLNPYRQGSGPSALTYSDFKDIFFFDAMLRQNKYHEIQSLDKKELMAKIKSTLSGKKDNHA